MADEFELSAKITGDASDLERALERAQNSTEDFADNIDDLTDNIEDGSQNWGFSFDKFYQKGISIFKDFGIDIDEFAEHFGVEGKLLSGIVAVTVALEKLGEKMQAMSSNIAKGTGATGKALQELKDSANDALVLGVGRSTEVVGEMIANLNTRFDLTGEELSKMTDQFDKFAKITGTDAANSIDAVADVIYKWGLSVDDTTDLMNQLVVASQKSGASVDELLSGVKSGQAIFSQFGMSLTDSIAFESALAKQGIDTSSAIMGMRTALAKFAEQGVSAEQGFAKVSEQIKNSKTQTEALNIAVETFGSRSGPEMLRVLSDSSVSIDDFKNSMLEAGLAIEETEEASRTVTDALDDLKGILTGTFGGFGEGIANLFRDLIDSITSIVQGMAPIIRPIADIFNEVFSNIGAMIKTFIQNLVELQTKYNYVFKAVADILVQVRDVMRKILKNVMDIFGNAFGMIFAILDGKWSLVWEYAKNSMLKVADAILSAISSLVNAFGGMINAFVDKINVLIDKYNELAESSFGEFFGMKKGKKLKPFENLDLSGMSGLTDAIEKSNAKIAELTGKTAEKITGDLAKAEEVSTNFSIQTEKQIAEQLKLQEEATKQRLAWEDKLLQQEMSRLDFEKSEALKDAQRKKMSVKAQNEIIEEYNKKQIELYEKIAEKKKEIDLKQAKSEEEKASIIKYYQDDLAIYTDKLNSQKLKKETNFWTKFLSMLKNVTKKIGSMLSNAFKNIFGKAFDGSTDELLNDLLGFEDKVLTFFTETLPKMPDLISSIMDSIVHLITTLTSNPQFAKTIVDIILKIAEILINNFPILLETALKLVVDLVSGIISNLPKIISMLIKALPNIIKTLVTSIWDMIKEAFNAIGRGFQKAWNWFKGLFGFATGVNNAPSGLALVGEQGPELIDFKGGERVYNAQDTRQILSGTSSNSGGNNFNVTFNNVQDTTAFTMIQQLKDFDRQLAINGVL